MFCILINHDHLESKMLCTLQAFVEQLSSSFKPAYAKSQY